VYYRACDPLKVGKNLQKKRPKIFGPEKRKERKLESRSCKKGLLKSLKRKSLQKVKKGMEFQKHRTGEATKESSKT